MTTMNGNRVRESPFRESEWDRSLDAMLEDLGAGQGGHLVPRMNNGVNGVNQQQQQQFSSSMQQQSYSYSSSSQQQHQVRRGRVVGDIQCLSEKIFCCIVTQIQRWTTQLGTITLLTLLVKLKHPIITSLCLTSRVGVNDAMNDTIFFEIFFLDEIFSSDRNIYSDFLW